MRYKGYAILGILFILDNITTHIARNLGYPELNEAMIPYADNVLSFLIVKILVLMAFICIFEFFVYFSKKTKHYSQNIQYCLLGIVAFGILLYSIVVCGNVYAIAQGPKY